MKFMKRDREKQKVEYNEMKEEYQQEVAKEKEAQEKAAREFQEGAEDWKVEEGEKEGMSVFFFIFFFNFLNFYGGDAGGKN
jgi:hypothetical protein